MTWKDLLKNQRMKPHQTSQEELHDLRSVVERDLKDAKLDQLSADRRFATAYNAVLQLTKMVIACEGYRVTGLGHHQTTFEALQLAMGKQVSTLVPYFDACRRKRNHVDYDMTNAASETEAEELIAKAGQFQKLVEDWIRKAHSKYGL